jgi:hypothetical protein
MKAGDKAKAGFHFNLRTWDITLHGKTGDTLPGGAEDRYVRIPAVALLFLGPILGLTFVIFLPVIGFALVALEIGKWTMRFLGRHRLFMPKAAKG